MTHTTFEEAKKCPKCGIMGQDMSQQRVSTGPNSDIRPGTIAHIIMCMNPDCRWYQTSWPVQVNPDGTVPVVPKEHHLANKQYPTISKERIQPLIDAQEALAQREQLKNPDGTSTEIRQTWR